MKRTTLVVSALALVGCGQSGDGAATNEVANKAQPKKKPTYCFFKDSETKEWAASRDKDGNVVVKGKAYRSDPRYQAVFKPPVVSGSGVELSPTIQQNVTGYGAQDNWWDLTTTIPNSATIDTVTVSCGAKTLAEFKVPPKG